MGVYNFIIFSYEEVENVKVKTGQKALGQAIYIFGDKSSYQKKSRKEGQELWLLTSGVTAGTLSITAIIPVAHHPLLPSP